MLKNLYVRDYFEDTFIFASCSTLKILFLMVGLQVCDVEPEQSSVELAERHFFSLGGEYFISNFYDGLLNNETYLISYQYTDILHIFC